MVVNNHSTMPCLSDTATKCLLEQGRSFQVHSPQWYEVHYTCARIALILVPLFANWAETKSNSIHLIKEPWLKEPWHPRKIPHGVRHAQCLPNALQSLGVSTHGWFYILQWNTAQLWNLSLVKKEQHELQTLQNGSETTGERTHICGKCATLCGRIDMGSQTHCVK